ncbi:MAG: tRNA (guanosine(46)-N7)-methyltransferase TrmB [Verrucomicrobia bacterium RIFCSPLOWO2_12_FULL_64_8]|nr:MAG: tRNA (guanosine(46)-N7)-methyltransferase TrmB [Verrucomicrobia bacterium RIFCSPLOWO2_12_FULL_64_8]
MPSPEYAALRAARLADLRTEIAAALPASDASFVLEIGCGHGHFLSAYAAAHPARLCIGLDLRLERILKARRKRDRAGLVNLHFIRGEARDFLRELPPGARLLDIYLLFPDPWPKKRHHKHRLLKAEFLDELAARAGEGSRFFFRTDHQPYFEEAAAVVSGHASWRVLPPGPFAYESESIFQSRAPAYHSLAAVWVSPPTDRQCGTNSGHLPPHPR